MILAAVKSWFCPINHACNKQWIARNNLGWTGVERVQCESCGKWRRLPAGLDGWPRVFYCPLNYWDSRFASCTSAEEEWQRDLPMSGDPVVCELASGVWLEGTVAHTPRAAEWQRLPRIGLPPPPPPPEPKAGVIGGDPRKSADDPLSCMVFSSRARKQVQLYDASTTSTEYTRALKLREEQDEALRKTAISVQFVDGVSRCLVLDATTKGKRWVHPRDLTAQLDKVRRTVAPPKASALSAGGVLLFRVDGKGWRKIRLVRRINRREWRHIREHSLGSAPAPASASARAAAPTPAAERCTLPPTGPSCAKPTPQSRRCHADAMDCGVEDETSCGTGSHRGGGCAVGGGTNALGAHEAAMARAEAEAAARLARAAWWRCDIVSETRRRRRRILLELAPANRLVLWHVPSDLNSACGSALAAEEQSVDSDDDDDDDDGENGDEPVASVAEEEEPRGGEELEEGAPLEEWEMDLHVFEASIAHSATPLIGGGGATVGRTPAASRPSGGTPAVAGSRQTGVGDGLGELSDEAKHEVLSRAMEMRQASRPTTAEVHGWRLVWQLRSGTRGDLSLHDPADPHATPLRSIASLKRRFGMDADDEPEPSPAPALVAASASGGKVKRGPGRPKKRKSIDAEEEPRREEPAPMPRRDEPTPMPRVTLRLRGPPGSSK